MHPRVVWSLKVFQVCLFRFAICQWLKTTSIRKYMTKIYWFFFGDFSSEGQQTIVQCVETYSSNEDKVWRQTEILYLFFSCYRWAQQRQETFCFHLILHRFLFYERLHWWAGLLSMNRVLNEVYYNEQSQANNFMIKTQTTSQLWTNVTRYWT